ncbi:MAG: hypothetical protein K6A82_03935 [Prevotella sp.]|nr:hypothetical protein [Prevotella sp.]
MEKKNYTSPSIKLKDIDTEQLMAALSGSTSEEPYGGAAASKENDSPVYPQAHSVWDE